MAVRHFRYAAGLILLLGTIAAREAKPTANVSTQIADEQDGTNWLAYGRTYSSDHFSPLTQINAGNVTKLGLSWFTDLPGNGSLLTTPLAADGVLYFSSGYNVIYALNAQTGQILWQYDPQVTAVAGDKIRRAWGSRGLGFWNGKIYVGTVDGRLIAIDARTGKPVWTRDTTDGPDDGRYITGAPWVYDGKVTIGHGGADYHSPLRGYVTTYDAETGKQLWRFYTVPGDPSKGFENSAMAMAATTWKGEWWKFGGGGTVWNAMAYDPKYHRLYIGVGNGDPWNQKVRSPGGGDNLFLSSIVALDADTGNYVWHYQTSPGETWDYVAAMDIELATLNIDGKPRDVILHAPKNGFFYVIDRKDGQLISAEKFASATNWAYRIDMKSGRPVENPAARFPDGKPFIVYPGPVGAHNVEPMSFSPTSGLAYIPTREMGYYFNDAGIDPKTWKPKPGVSHMSALAGGQPATPIATEKTGLIAWDPVHQKEAWSVALGPYPNGGATSTAGNLVFQGTAEGKFVAYSADAGKVLWSFDAKGGICSEPISYTVNGKQYVAVLVGYRGIPSGPPYDYRREKRRVLTFALNDNLSLPAGTPLVAQFADDPKIAIDMKKAEKGRGLAAEHCMICHGGGLVSGGAAPDLRASQAALSKETFKDIVQNGALVAAGMPRFHEIRDDDLDDLYNYVRLEGRNAAQGKATTDGSGVEVLRQ